MTNDTPGQVAPHSIYVELIAAIAGGVNVPLARIEKIVGDAGIDAAQFERDLTRAGRAASASALEQTISDARAAAWSKPWTPDANDD